MVFLEPWFLLLLLLLPVLWFYPRGEKDARHVVLRALVFAFLFLGLARPVIVTNDARDVHVFVFDNSASAVAAGAANSVVALCEAAERAAQNADVSLVVFGGELQLEEEQRAIFERVHLLDNSAGESPIGAALQQASTFIPRDARGSLTLVSDGLATDRHWARAVQSIAARGLPVHTLALPRAGGDVFPSFLAPVQPLRVGSTARMQVDVVGNAAQLDVRLSGPNGELASLKGLSVAGHASFSLEFEPQAAGFLELRLEVAVTSGDNNVTDNDTLTRTFAVEDAQRVLYLGQRMLGGDGVLGNLVGRGFGMEAWNGEELRAADLAGYDLAVLDDLSADVLGAASQRALVSAVRDGGLGLFASGGAAAFGPGGYHKQPLEEILPVEFVQKEEKRDPSTTLVVIIDTSGSMGGNRVQLAKEVARLSIQRLLPHDKVGIVEFYGAKHWAAPIQPASNRIELERALNRLDAGGGTVILPAIEEAFYGMKNVQTRYKHVIVLTDGGVESGSFEPLLRNMANDGINVSTVLIGSAAHSEFLVTLANWGKGRFYSVPNRFNLPEILLKQPASAKLPSYRPGVHVVQARGGAGWWGDVDMGSLPQLAGYVETRDRAGCEVLLETEQGGHPILGTWRYGLGRVTAFTSEPTGPGTESWRAWDGFGPWLAHVLERTASDQRAPYTLRLEREGNEMVLHAERRLPEASALAVRRIATDGGEDRALELRERAPGQLEARFAASPAEQVRLMAEAAVGVSIHRTRLVSDANADVRAERQVDPAAALDLELLSVETGGQALAAAELMRFEPAAGGGTPGVDLTRLWPWSVLVALLFYLLEIYYRRSGLRRVTQA